MDTNRIRIIRKEKGLTLKELSEKTKISFSAISMYERGEIDPASDKLRKIAEELGVSMEELLGKIAFPDGEVNLQTPEEKDHSIAIDILSKQQDVIGSQQELLKEQQQTIAKLVEIVGREK